LNVRGGADDTEYNVDDDTIIMASDSDGESGMDGTRSDAMRELRRKWSSVPATPTIAWPVADIAPEDDAAGNTLGDIDGENDHVERAAAAPGDQRTTATATATKAIIIMDGFSPYHGQYLAHAARRDYGAAAIFVLSDFLARYLHEVEGQTDHLSSRLPDLDDAEEIESWMSSLPESLEVCGIYCESDSGLEDAERLGVSMGLYPGRHDGVNDARRDKYLMNRMVSKAGGLDVVRQRSCRTLEEAEDFARELGLGEEETGEGGGSSSSSVLVVVKPPRGVASDDVHLCRNLPSLRTAFDKILSSPVFGSSTAARHESVLVQEFATGTEYAIDVVCRDGERKAAALWRYDKRAVNGAPFVYHATELVSAADKEGGEADVEREVCDYAFRALDALGVRWGLSHVEVIAGTSAETGRTRVRLVEVNCRQHNTDFVPLTNACIGYNALDMVLAAHLGDNTEDEGSPRGRDRLQWDSVPVLPTTRAHGAVVHFVSHVEGSISNIRFDVLGEVEDLPSVMDMHVYPQFMEVGNPIEKTVDIRSDTGWAHLMSDDEEEFRRDYNRLVELMKDMFEVE